MKPFFISIPHSGERVPPEADWLTGLPEPVLMCDVDRYVDQLYRPVIEQLAIPSVVAQWHRYAADLNRLPDDVDADSVEGSGNPSGKFSTGLHWVVTTKGDQLMPRPISLSLHEQLLKKYFVPFHMQVESMYQDFKDQGFAKVYQLDAHSMPSVGTQAHRDPGEQRPEIVVSDVDGTSCEESFKNLVVQAYEKAGFQVACNWPYKGGRVTQTYGKPELGQHAIQVEMSRALYMDESSKGLKVHLAEGMKQKVAKAVGYIFNSL